MMMDLDDVGMMSVKVDFDFASRGEHLFGIDDVVV